MLAFAFLVLPVAMYGLLLGGMIFLIWAVIANFTKAQATHTHFIRIWFVSSLAIFAYFFGDKI